MNVLRKNYSRYKDGLPIVDITATNFKKIEKGVCVRARLNLNGSKVRIRVRLKPKKRLTLIQENALLKRQIAKLTNRMEVV